MGILLDEEVKVTICEELKHQVLVLNEEEKQVIIHCSVYAADAGDAARIWRSTYLMDHVTGKRYELLFAEGISYAPQWTLIPSNRPLEFTLVFRGLPKSCRVFDLIEVIPEEGGFEVLNIARTPSDVYYLTIQ